MTKKELYDKLTAAGVKLPAYNKVTLTILQEQAAIYLQELPTVETGDNGAAEQKNPPSLFFSHAGWCEKLKTSYFIGRYQPTSWEEYEALRPFAQGGAK